MTKDIIITINDKNKIENISIEDNDNKIDLFFNEFTENEKSAFYFMNIKTLIQELMYYYENNKESDK